MKEEKKPLGLQLSYSWTTRKAERFRISDRFRKLTIASSAKTKYQHIKSIKLVSPVILLHNEFSCMCLKVHLSEYKIRLQYIAFQCKVWHI